MEISIKKAESQPLPKRIDTGKATITKPELIKKYLELEPKEKRKELTVKESRQYYRLKKNGDNAPAQNKLTDCPNRPTKTLDLAKLNKNPHTTTKEDIQKVIDSIYNGIHFIKACEINNVKPKDFFNMIDRPEFSEEKNQFYIARCCLAEYYLSRREYLEEDLRSNKIDSSTYSTLANDYKYLAGKLAPLAYGDKIQLDAQINKTQTYELINSDKVKQLNSLLNPDIIDADFEEN